MASFTETVERRNPALTATGLAVWGLIIRAVIAVSVFIVPLVVDTVTTLVEKGPVAQQIIAAHPTGVAAAQKLSPTTQAALAANPTDPTAQAQAASDVSGIPVRDVGTLAALQAQHGSALAAAQAIDPATQATLLQNPADGAAVQKAVSEITSTLGISAEEATQRLLDLASIPKDQLALAGKEGAALQKATAALQDLSKIPAVDLAILTDASTAAEHSPRQWQQYFWIAVGGEILFIPMIFLMAGHWSTRRARAAEREHEAWLTSELAKLAPANPSSDSMPL